MKRPSKFWKFIHNVIAAPLHKWSKRFRDWTAKKSFPPKPHVDSKYVDKEVQRRASCACGAMHGFAYYSLKCPRCGQVVE